MHDEQARKRRATVHGIPSDTGHGHKEAENRATVVRGSN